MFLNLVIFLKHLLNRKRNRGCVLKKGYKNASFLICYNQNLDITQTFIKGDLIKNCAYNNHYLVIKFSNE